MGLHIGRFYIRSIWENPVWLLLSSCVIFSVIVILFLTFRTQLFYTNKIHLAGKNTKPSQAIMQENSNQDVLSIAISHLQKKTYLPSTLLTAENISSGGNFTSKIISYTVDGLREYALLDTPGGPKPANGFPVVIVDHGYVIPSQYNTIASYAEITNYFAENGYIVLKPDFRGNGNSQGAEDPLQRYSYPVDVMTLLVSIKNIPSIDMSRVYLWGHSMGGEVTLEVMEILGANQKLVKVRGAVLWAPVTDPAKWFGPDNIKKIPEATLTPFPYSKTFALLGQPSDTALSWQSINPLNYLSSITIPIQLNHGSGDETVPYKWSVDLYTRLQAIHKQITFITYPGADHNLVPDSSQALQNSMQFFTSH